MATNGALPGCLAGVRVLDLTQFEAGPSCTEPSERLGAGWAGLELGQVQNPDAGKAAR